MAGDPDEPLPAADHYFTPRPRSASRPREVRFLYRGQILVFAIDAGLFATHGLDPGTALLIEDLVLRPTDRVLDLGCGWGPIGVAAARQAVNGHVVLTDVNRRAVWVSRRNLRTNHITNAEVRPGSFFAPVAQDRFDVIATNPPYHAGRPAILRMLEEAPAHLVPGGHLLMVGKGSQGIRFYQAQLEAGWPVEVTVRGRGGGYRVLDAVAPG